MGSVISEKILKDPLLGDVVFRKRKGLRRMSIRVHPVKGITVQVDVDPMSLM